MPSTRRRSRRGIFIIAVLFFAVVVTMFLGAAIALAPGGLGQARLLTAQDTAERAALSGIEYVLARLRQNPYYAFSGSGNSGYRVAVDTPELFVAEDHGNIVGLVWDRNGSATPAQFRVRFNYQDGAGADQTERLTDPSQLTLDLSWPSCNNLPGAGDVQIPQALESGNTAQIQVPARTIYLAVEGRAGSGLSRLSRTSPNAAPGFGPVSRKFVQTVYKVTNMGAPIVEAAMMSAGDIHIALPSSSNGRVELSNTARGIARLRSKQQISVDGGDAGFNVDSLEVGKLASSDPASSKYKASSKISSETETAQAAFPQISWADAPKADGSHKLAAGTYVVSQEGKLLYFDMGPEDYAKSALLGEVPGGKEAVLPQDAMKFVASADKKRFALQVLQDVLVEPSAAGTQEFAFMPKRGAAAAPPTTTSSSAFSFTEKVFYSVTNGGRGPTATSSGEAGRLFGQLLMELGGIQPQGTSPPIPGGGMPVQISPIAGSRLEAAKHEFSFHEDGSFEVTGPPGQIPAMLNDLNSRLASQMSSPSTPLTKLLEGLQNSLSTGGGLSVGGSSDELTTENLQLEFIPPEKKSATLTVPGKVSVGAAVRGNGGSIGAEGDIDFYGFGVDLSNDPGGRNGVSLYSKRNINIRTYYEGQSQTGNDGYHDVALKGVVYAWGDVNLTLGNPTDDKTWRRFQLVGGLISYGGDPTGPPVAGASQISLMTSNAHLQYDPAYLLNLQAKMPPSLKMERLSWSLR